LELFAGLLVPRAASGERVAIQSISRRVEMRYVLLWALGVPITGIIVLHLFGII
jgi:hypothetical protein